MKKALVTTFITTLTMLGTSISAQADTIFGIYAGASAWSTDAEGGYEVPDFAGGFDVNVEESTGESNSMAYVAVEHPVPMLPNIKLSQTNINHEGDGYYTLGGGAPVSFDGEMELNHTDITLYYEVLDNWITLDLGLTARLFDGFLSVGFSDQKSDLDSTHGMLYGKAQIELPFTGWGFGTELNVGKNGNEEGVDVNAYFQYETSLGLGFAAGYRALDAELEAKAKDPVTRKELEATADFDVSGPYLSVFIHI